MVNQRCYLDVSIGGEVEGRLVVELYNDSVPEIAQNFMALCTAEKDIVPLHFKGSSIHNIFSGLTIQGGDDTSTKDGAGCETIYGLVFEEENFKLKHERKGVLSMTNTCPDSDTTELFIICDQDRYLDGEHVVFGRILKGMGVLKTIEHVRAWEWSCPYENVVIADCGEILEGEDDGVCNFYKDGDVYPEWPADLDSKPEALSWWMEAVNSIKAFGNEYKEKNDYKMALRKYRKAFRYLDICLGKEELDDENNSLLQRTKAQIHTSSADCKLILEDPEGALTDIEHGMCDSAEDNAKTLNCLGQVYLLLDDIDAAAKSFDKALALAPNDDGIKKGIAAVEKKFAERSARERKLFNKMFALKYFTPGFSGFPL